VGYDYGDYALNLLISIRHRKLEFGRHRTSHEGCLRPTTTTLGFQQDIGDPVQGGNLVDRTILLRNGFTRVNSRQQKKSLFARNDSQQLQKNL